MDVDATEMEKGKIGNSMKQKTIKSEMTFKGVGIHNGIDTTVKCIPEKANTGIYFVRTDLDKSFKIPATWDNVGTTKFRNTTIGQVDGPHIQTVEHFMASLYINGITNLRIEIDRDEFPILDGSIYTFLKKIDSIGIVQQTENRKILRVLKEVKVDEENGVFASFLPSSYKDNLTITNEIVYDKFSIIGKQSFSLKIDLNSVKENVQKARTFGHIDEHEYLKQNNMAKGCSLDNVIVINKDGDGIINRDGLHYDKEFVKHKIIDSIGDIALCGYFIIADFYSYKGGHSTNNKLLKKLFEDPTNFVITDK